MTDFSDDELVSAVLDGEATAEEAARVRADPALSSRLVELQAARDHVREARVEPPSRADRDAAIAAAVRTAPTDLHERRRRRRRTVRIAAAAAAVVVLAGVIGVFVASSRRTSTSSTAALASQSPASSTASPSTPSPTHDLGAFSTRQDLVDAVRRVSTSQAAAAVPAPQSQTRSQDQDQAAGSTADEFGVAAGPCTSSRSGVEFAGTAVLGGQPVVVLVVDGPTGRVLEVDDTSCGVVFSQAL